MTATVLVRPENSTTVRSISAREAARRFAEPQRPAAPRVPEIEGIPTDRSSLLVSGQPLSVYQWGSGRAPAVLLAHGFAGSAAQMTAFIPALLKAGYRAVAFDQPAHGMSPGRSAHLVDFARNITAVARAFGARSVIAHSLGAVATMIAHSRGLRLDRAVLIAPPSNVEHFAGAFARAVELPPTELPAMLTEVERELGYPLRLLDVRNLAGITEGAPADVLVLHDEADAEVPYEHGRTLVHHWPNARLTTVRGVGHRRVLRDAAAVALSTDHIVH
jgi:pimeloyl-ACP methyl ester carboxylesterase